MSKRVIQKFYKLVFGSFRSTPHQLPIFFEGIPLHFPAKFDGDRYIFSLPLNLAEKMVAGELIADFCYSEVKNRPNETSNSPTFILLSERYG